MTAYEDVPGLAFSVDKAVLGIEMINPGRRNALGDIAIEAFVNALAAANMDEQVRAILISGAGADFCAGADIVARNAGDGPRPRVGAISRRLPVQAHRLIPLLRTVQVPVVAAVRGHAVGLGMQIALAADFAVVAQTASFWEPFSRRGMGPDSGASWLLPRIVGLVRARELLLLGRTLTGIEAGEWGIAHEVVADADVPAAARALASTLAQGPTVALGLSRLLINNSAEAGLVEHLAAEGYGMEVSSRSPDFREGLAAFLQKREPVFNGM